MGGRDLIVITKPGLSTGFELAGVEVVSAPDAQAAARILEVIDPRIAVAIVDEHLYAGLPEELRRSLNRVATPIVVPVPSPDWSEESKAHEYIVDILRRAIGYRVKLQ